MTTHRVPDFTAPEEGELTVVTVDSRPVAVAASGGRLYAFDDTCTHQQCSLSEGEVEGGSVVCPCHGGTFDMTTGKVLDGPPPSPITAYAAELVDGVLELQLPG